jgi:hypothetical protein
MKKQLILIGIIVIFNAIGLIGLSGCTKSNTQNNNLTSDEEKLISNWRCVTDYYVIKYEYRLDKTWDSTTTTFKEEPQIDQGTWKITDNKLFLNNSESTQDSITLDYIFSNNYNTITFTEKDGASYIYNRQ